MKPLTRLLAAAAMLLMVPIFAQAQTPFISPTAVPTTVASTVPLNGDVNPYGVVVVPASTGNLVAGDILVSNFNNSNNQQGTGSTIVQISPQGASTLFAQISLAPGQKCTGGIGLTTALAIVQKKFVVVGSLPTADGTAATVAAGCLIVLDDTGKVVETFTNSKINGPWDMTAIDQGDESLLFVTTVLPAQAAVTNKGTVERITMKFSSTVSPITPTIEDPVTIGSLFPVRTDQLALVVGPTGLALDSSTGTLYVADTLEGRIAAITNAVKRGTTHGTGSTVAQGGSLFAPLGLALAPNGDILTVNGNDGNLVESKAVASIAQFEPINLDITSATPFDPGFGALFGVAVAPANGVYFVDDLTNTLNVAR